MLRATPVTGGAGPAGFASRARAAGGAGALHPSGSAASVIEPRCVAVALWIAWRFAASERDDRDRDVVIVKSSSARPMYWRHWP